MIPLLFVSLALAAAAQQTTSTTSSSTPNVTALSDCHLHDLVQYCVSKPDGKEIEVTTASDQAAASALSSEYTDCHTHEGETYCVNPDGEDIFIPALSSESTDEHEDHDGESHEDEAEAEAEDEAEAEAEAESEESSSGENCHFHAGVEHCTGGSSTKSAASTADACARRDRSYNIPLRIGSIFIVLCTSGISIFLPLLLRRFSRLNSTHIAFTVIKQFGTGVIIATAFIHLLTHAALMFNNECVGELGYEATTTAIAMGGLFVAAVVEYAGHRYIEHRSDLTVEQSAESGSSSVASKIPLPPLSSIGCHAGTSDDKLSVFVMEMGIIFHSILIGITLVVAGDTVFTTLLIVIIFHQGFEGLALGARISNLAPTESLDFTKLFLASMFALITPIGMAIGIGIRDRFNGNDRETLIALGTLDAISAGILVWVGVVEMAAGDWLWGELRRASIGRTLVAGLSMVSGMVLMGLLGKWA